MTETDFNRWGEALTVPPVRDSLRLCDYLSAELQAEFLQGSGLPRELLSYTWLLEEHCDKVLRWAKGLVSTGRANKKTSFFAKPILETYNYDRALRAAEAFRTQPILRKDIPARLTKRGPLPSVQDGPLDSFALHSLLAPSTDNLRPRPGDIHYILVRKKFDWNRETPAEAVDAVALVMETEPPDELWIAEYVEKSKLRKWDPIIYASYGDWQVEVARWD
jgi:hypothetical protein